MNQNLFTTLLQPVETFIVSTSEIIDHQSDSQKLFFADFVRKLIFGSVYEAGSLRNLVLQLKTNPVCRELGLEKTPFSTLKDGFSRFASSHFRQLMAAVIEESDLRKVKWLDEIGVFRLIDGSIFPTLISMNWTSYRKNKNAFKLHLSFDLNRMIAAEFRVGSGNSSERAFLAEILEKGLTYIADRGYFSFKLADQIKRAQAYFIMRGRENLRYEVVEKLDLKPKQVPECLAEVTDQRVIFTGDAEKNEWRLIKFKAAGNSFRLLTNRFDLTTEEIITLYAYRWQIELFFKFMKRTLKGLHLWNHSENGVEIQFYLLMTAAVLMLKLKQECQKQEKKAQQEEKRVRKKEEKSRNPSKWIKGITEIFYQSWKISKNWLTVVRNSLAQPLDSQLLRMLSCL